MKQPIAMRCTKKQFKAIKPKLKEIGKIGLLLGAFKEYKYLTNNYNKEKNYFDFVDKTGTWISEHKNNIHEEWNEKIFLKACGIEVEKTFCITESQIKEFCKFNTANENLLKQLIPEAFESEVKELKIGTWYKSNDTLFNHQEGKNSYGILRGKWQQGNWHTKKEYFSGSIIEANEEEVLEALKNEAVKRGYKEGVLVKSLFHKNNPELNIKLEDFELVRGSSIHCSGDGGCCPVIFENGIWAEIIPTITLSEAEQQLKKKIIV